MNVRQVVPKDAIPSVDDPRFGPTYDGDPTDEVITITRADPPRAYPLRYLHHHEIVNDALADGADPIAVTWCPLCGSAIVYDRGIDDRVLSFGVSGKLADDDLVMYDRETESEWKQSTGTCFAGPLEGTALTVRPAQVLPWQAFRDSFPAGVVLQPPGGESESASASDDPAPIDYDDDPYTAYFAAEGFGLAAHRGTAGDRSWERRDDLDPKTVVLGVECADRAVGFPLPRVREEGGIVQATVGETAVLVVATDTVGIQAYHDPGYEFRWQDGTLTADGATWDPATGRSDDGRSLSVVPARRLFAFAWQDDHGPEAFYGSPTTGE
ncbi:MAG: DUF3179 domain-containing protein [Halobacteriaceae archaeon]